MARRKTTEEFIAKARQIHGNKYDYSKVEYEKNDIPVCIICPIHGEFWQTPKNHLKKQGCRKCGLEKNIDKRKYSTEEFIQKAKIVHINKYDYSKIDYRSIKEKVCIICPIHGEFWQTPSDHLCGKGCPQCGLLQSIHKRKITKDDFIKRCQKIHGEKYDYSKVEYHCITEKVCIICPTHGEFWQRPHDHLRGQGCPKCANNVLYDVQNFIEKAKQVHGDKYDYSKVEYVNSHTKVCIICPIHGEFWQIPSKHLRGEGCAYCSGNVVKTTEEFVTQLYKIYGDKYDYSKVKYVNSNTKVCIICPIHGEIYVNPTIFLRGHGCVKCMRPYKNMTQEEYINEFNKIHHNKYIYENVNINNKKIEVICPIHGSFFVSPYLHFKGIGCPKCKSSHLEREIRSILNKHQIEYEEQKKFTWLGKQSLDFYLLQFNIAIECQGRQHFEMVNTFGGEKQFHITQVRDKVKKELCENNDVKLLYYTNIKEFDIFLGEKLLKNENELLENLHI